MASRPLSAPLRVALVTSAFSAAGGGVAEVASRLAAELGQNGVRVTIVTTRDAGLWAAPAGVAIQAYRYFGPQNFRFSPGLMLALFRLKPDLVHLHGLWSCAGLAVLLWAKVAGGRYVVSPHGMLETWILARSKRLKRAVAWLYQDRLITSSAAVQALTESERQSVLRLYPGVAVRVIANFVQMSTAAPGRPNWWQPEFERRTVFLFFGRIHEKKGWRELCAAWEQFCATPHHAAAAELVFCGWQDQCPDFEPLVARMGQRFGNVRYAGPQVGADRAASLDAADFLVLPSKSEGLPMAVLEGFATRLPALLSQECGLSEAYAAGAAHDCGIDPNTILASLTRATALPKSERAKMARNAQRFVQTMFSPGRVVGDLIGLYQSLARSRP